MVRNPPVSLFLVPLPRHSLEGILGVYPLLVFPLPAHGDMINPGLVQFLRRVPCFPGLCQRNFRKDAKGESFFFAMQVKFQTPVL